MNLPSRALLSLLFHGEKAVDAVGTALDLGILDAVDSEPTTLGELSERFGLVPMRLYKLLDCLECLGLVTRTASNTLHDTEYRATDGARAAAVDVLGPDSIERDRDSYPWRTLHGNLPAVLAGRHGIPASDFAWPPQTPDQIAGFERSMAAGIAPIAESFRMNTETLWPPGQFRLLDIGGGDGTLAAHLLDHHPDLRVDIYNLPAVAPLVSVTRAACPHSRRLGFVGGDFFADPLPTGYDALAFVRVLHDWPLPEARLLLEKAHRALPPGGRLLICEEFRDPERLARQFFWSYFLIGVDTCTSLLRAATEYHRLLTDLGFHEIRILPGPFDIIVATKP
ncbi:methyltransferase domain-containing protein [Nocardia panacis]|uniref:Methyltransferase domain-containing protein n=1 Tax=Nocardia panacis TaxID=2340916 RepID=A0A3A4K8R9_9NOCA|nr:methyltransferase [Nocardia panacis]RJO75624.1 methyltransferase domain-containing protein [Nocardia panacis]